MKQFLIAFAICGVLSAASPVTPKKSAPKKPDVVATITSQPEMSRTLTYSEHEIPTIHTRKGYTSTIILPKTEIIMDLLSGGDKSDWSVGGAESTNFANVTPRKAGAPATNLNLITASGNVYSFLLVEGGGEPPDLKVFVEPKDAVMETAIAAPPKWVLSAELDLAKQQLDIARRQTEEARAAGTKAGIDATDKAEREIAAFRSNFPSSLKHDYRYKDKRDEFGVKAMAHSDKFTYIWADPSETPTLYELKDGKPSLINFAYSNNVYVVPKVLGSGYITVGKHRMDFKRDN